VARAAKWHIRQCLLDSYGRGQCRHCRSDCRLGESAECYTARSTADTTVVAHVVCEYDQRHRWHTLSTTHNHVCATVHFRVEHLPVGPACSSARGHTHSSLYLRYDSGVTIDSIPAYRFTVPKEVFVSTGDNIGFCVGNDQRFFSTDSPNTLWHGNGSRYCLSDGMLDVSECLGGRAVARACTLTSSPNRHIVTALPLLPR
jgi:hypothetical protein